MSDPAIPEGLQLAHTFWGEPDTSVTHAHTAHSGRAGDVRLATPSGVPYMDDPQAVYVEPPVEAETVSEPETVPPGRHPRMCIANDNTCKSWKMKGSNLCYGHTYGWPGRKVDREPQ